MENENTNFLAKAIKDAFSEIHAQVEQYAGDLKKQSNDTIDSIKQGFVALNGFKQELSSISEILSQEQALCEDLGDSVATFLDEVEDVLLYGEEIVSNSVYHCFNCGKVITDEKVEGDYGEVFCSDECCEEYSRCEDLEDEEDEDEIDEDEDLEFDEEDEDDNNDNA